MAKALSPVRGAAMSWIMGHLPPPDGVELHIVCPVVGMRDLTADAFGIRRVCEDDFAFDPLNTADGKDHLRKVMPHDSDTPGTATCSCLPSRVFAGAKANRAGRNSACREATCGKTFLYKGAVWHPVEKKRFEPLWGYRRLAREVKRIVDEVRPDVVHGWGGEVGCGLIATMVAKRAVVSVQGLLRLLEVGSRKYEVGSCKEERGFKYWLRERLEAKTYRRAKVCLCESETARGALKRLYGVDGVVVPQPLRPEFLGPVASSKYEVASGMRYLFVGQDVPRKGIQDVREAFLQLSTSTRQKPTLTVITGGKSAAEIAELMRTHDVFVLPSYGDTGPTAIKEALAMGMRVIAYDNTGPKELVERYGGVLVKTGDVPALAMAMQEVGSRELRVGSGERIRKDLSRETVWSRLLEVYGRVVSR